MRVLASLLFACALVLGPASAAFAGWTDSLFPSHEDDGSASVQDIVPAADPDNSHDTREQQVKRATRAFYEDRNFKLVWSGNDDADERASTVRLALEHADHQGLAGND